MPAERNIPPAKLQQAAADVYHRGDERAIARIRDWKRLYPHELAVAAARSRKVAHVLHEIERLDTAG